MIQGIYIEISHRRTPKPTRVENRRPFGKDFFVFVLDFIDCEDVIDSIAVFFCIIPPPGRENGRKEG